MLQNKSFTISPGKKTSYNEQSPSKMKINMQTEKQTNLNIADDDKAHKKEFFEHRVKAIYDKITKSHTNDEARIKLLKESISKLGEDFYSEKAMRELFEAKKEKGLKTLEGNLAQLVSEDEIDRRELEANVTKQMEDKFAGIRHEIITEKKRKDITENSSIKGLNDTLSTLQGMISEERKNREEGYELQIKKLGDEILRINEALSVARRNREDTHNKIVRHLDETQNKQFRELANEKAGRERNEGTLTRFLEETIKKTTTYDDYY